MMQASYVNTNKASQLLPILRAHNISGLPKNVTGHCFQIDLQAGASKEVQAGYHLSVSYPPDKEGDIETALFQGKKLIYINDAGYSDIKLFSDEKDGIDDLITDIRYMQDIASSGTLKKMQDGTYVPPTDDDNVHPPGGLIIEPIIEPVVN